MPGVKIKNVAHLPEFLNMRSTTRQRKKPTPVIAHPVIKSGLRTSAPMSEIYAMCSSDLYLGLPEANHTISMAQSMKYHIVAVASGIQT